MNLIHYEVNIVDFKMLELRTPMYQRVYQYLQLYDSKKFSELDKFIYHGTIEGSDKDCLETILRSECCMWNIVVI